VGTPSQPSPVKLIAGLLSSAPDLLDDVRAALCECFGPVAPVSAPAEWSLSTYYAAEMGASLWRQFVAFEHPVAPGDLADIKCRTNVLERRWHVEARRRVNIDPGLLDLNKVVLASTKDAAHRIYLGDGIYAEATLRFEHGSFRPYPYTYPDYAAPETLAFFNAVRQAWRNHRSGRR